MSAPQLDAFVEKYRAAFEVTLDGLTEGSKSAAGSSRRRPRLLGLLKHVTWMQRVRCEECVGWHVPPEVRLGAEPGRVELADDEIVASIRRPIARPA